MARYVNGQVINEYPMVTAQNWDYYNPQQSTSAQQAGNAASTAAKSIPFLTRFYNRFGPNKSLFNGQLSIPNLREFARNVRATHLWEGGPTIAKGANTISGIYQGGKALKGLYDNIQAETDINSLKNDISLAMASNPMYDMYLDASDEKLLRQMKNGTLTNSWDEAASGTLKGIPQAALSALLGYVTGGPGGAAIGGIGSLINSGISGYGQGIEQSSTKLQGLYNKLQQANDEYRSMKRPRGLSSAGLQSRYFNELY